jgi:CheY-like chemotaxis protein
MGLGSALYDGANVSSRKQKTILVVEDEFVIRMCISDAFRDEGYHVVEAFNADEAVDILRSGKLIDLVFSDVRMPGSIDGIGLLQFIKATFSAVPVIMASGHLEPSVAIAEGANDLLTKPYAVSAVLNLVNSHLNGSFSGSAI